MRNFILLILLQLSFMSMANTIPVTHLIGKFNEKTDSQFISLDSTELPVNKPNMYLQKEVVEQLTKVYHDFKKEHPTIPFVIVSATRNYYYQNQIWQRKWDNLYPKFKDSNKIAKEILLYSSMPGSSRHHWGTDFDITSVEPAYFQQNKQGQILYKWLQANMPKYGFCQPYNEGREGGYQPEEWHWSYLPLSKSYTQQYRQLLSENPAVILDQLDFAGHGDIDLLPLLNEYVLTINPACY